MSRPAVYLDYNATAPVRPQAAAAVAHALVEGGNPSSVHAAGRAARARVEQARDAVAKLIAAPASTVIFTSGGTEANALAIESAVAAGSRRLIVSAIEHDSVLEPARASGAAVELLPVTADGLADLAWLRTRLAGWDAAEGRPFVALMLANN
jgi:cysteine desulfurase